MIYTSNVNRYAAKYAEPGAQVRVFIIYDFTSPKTQAKNSVRCAMFVL